MGMVAQDTRLYGTNTAPAPTLLRHQTEVSYTRSADKFKGSEAKERIAGTDKQASRSLIDAVGEAFGCKTKDGMVCMM